MLGDGELKSELRKQGAKGQVLRIGPFPGEGSTDWAGLPLDDARWGSKESPIQSASVDLHVGYIYVPERKPKTLGGEGRGETSFTLEPGHSVIVSTYETVELPVYLSGIVFPPSELSSNGIMVANIGHIDPGYQGPLRFTIINMGAHGFPLERGKVAVGTIMFFRLAHDCQKSWLDRRTGAVTLRGEPKQAEIDALSKDFANFDHRVDELTTKKLGEKIRDMSVLAIVIPVVLSVILTYASIFITIGLATPGRVDRNTDDIVALQKAVDQTKEELAGSNKSGFDILAKRLDEFDDRLIKVEEQQERLAGPSTKKPPR
jgi:dCTP deaminase